MQEFVLNVVKEIMLINGGRYLQVILYSTHCPKCNILTKKLDQKNISYEEINDIKVMQDKGFLTAPILEVDGVCMGFKEASDWVNSQEDKDEK